MPVIPALRRERLEDNEFKVILSYTANSRGSVSNGQNEGERGEGEGRGGERRDKSIGGSGL